MKQLPEAESIGKGVHHGYRKEKAGAEDKK